ncbi:MAG: DUF262 domain-containing protein [Candidatus Saccharibacteria bacterium]|nr:DUF262 domain-containing protein [Candidatus Saccharibacteria bacterium]
MRATDGDIYDFIYTPGKWFKIPDFQRPYSWHRENSKIFLEDLETVLTSKKTHFFGSVVYETQGDESIIIDGQQRITTISLMIMAIYHLLEEDSSLTSPDLSADEIRERFLWNDRHTGDNKSRVKLRGIVNDARIFQQIYDKNVDDDGKQSEIYKVYRFFIDYFKDKTNLDRYIKALKDFKIVKVVLDPRDDQPQKIFESINATGKELDNGDKIRNFALMMDDSDLRNQVFHQYWVNIEQYLTDNATGRNDIADFFLRMLISEYQKHIKISDVYSEFKKFFELHIPNPRDQSQVHQFWRLILENLNRYCFLKYCSIKDEKLTIFSKPVARLSFLDMGVWLPFLIKVLKRWHETQLTDDQVITILGMTETYSIRRGLLKYYSTGLSYFYANLDKTIWDRLSKSQSSYEDIYSYTIINSVYECPKPETLKSRLGEIEFYRLRAPLQNCILSSYDDKKLPKESSLLSQLSHKDSAITIEHIMPQTLTPTWKSELGENWSEIHHMYRHNIANLTLTGYNSEYSNKSFSEKLNAPNGFAQSSLAINRDSVAIYKIFDEEALKDRMNWWLKTIEWMWPYPQSDYTPPSIDSTYDKILSSIQTDDLVNSQPQIVIFKQQDFSVNNWTDILEVVMTQLYEHDSQFISQIRADLNVNQEISQYSQDFAGSVSIGESDWLVNTASTDEEKIELLKKVIDLASINQQDIQIQLNSVSG